MSEAGTREEPAGKTILLAEDTTALREMVTTVLTMGGYEVLPHPDGQTAYACFRENTDRVDLIVADIGMPDMSGKELARKCRNERPDLGILYMSGFRDSSLELKEDLDGKCDFIEKPFPPAKLLEKVKVLVGEDSTES